MQWEQFLIVITLNFIALIVTIAKFQSDNKKFQNESEKKQAFWTGTITQKLEDLCKRVDRIENRVFNGSGRA